MQTYVSLYMEVRDQGGSSSQLLSILGFERGSSIESGAHPFSRTSWLTRQGILVSLPALHRVKGMGYKVQLSIWILGTALRSPCLCSRPSPDTHSLSLKCLFQRKVCSCCSSWPHIPGAMVFLPPQPSPQLDLCQYSTVTC